MSNAHTPAPIAPWEAHLTPWVSPYTDAPMALAPASAPVHPGSTNADHTGLRTSIAQFRLPRIKVSQQAA